MRKNTGGKTACKFIRVPVQYLHRQNLCRVQSIQKPFAQAYQNEYSYTIHFIKINPIYHENNFDMR